MEMRKQIGGVNITIKLIFPTPNQSRKLIFVVFYWFFKVICEVLLAKFFFRWDIRWSGGGGVLHGPTLSGYRENMFELSELSKTWPIL